MIKTMTIREVTREALATHAAFLKLGFRSDDIYFAVGKAKDPPSVRGLTHVGVILIAQDRRFEVTCGYTAEGHDAVVVAWKRVLKAWNTGGHMTNADKRELWEGSYVRQHATELCAALVFKGFKLKHNLN